MGINDEVLADLDHEHREIQALKSDLDDFKNAACPVLRSARMDDSMRVKFIHACDVR
jgi:hypothetical protein